MNYIVTLEHEKPENNRRLMFEDYEVAEKSWIALATNLLKQDVEVYNLRFFKEPTDERESLPYLFNVLQRLKR